MISPIHLVPKQQMRVLKFKTKFSSFGACLPIPLDSPRATHYSLVGNTKYRSLHQCWLGRFNAVLSFLQCLHFNKAQVRNVSGYAKLVSSFLSIGYMSNNLAKNLTGAVSQDSLSHWRTGVKRKVSCGSCHLEFICLKKKVNKTCFCRLMSVGLPKAK